MGKIRDKFVEEASNVMTLGNFLFILFSLPIDSSSIASLTVYSVTIFCVNSSNVRILDRFSKVLLNLVWQLCCNFEMLQTLQFFW